MRGEAKTETVTTIALTMTVEEAKALARTASYVTELPGTHYDITRPLEFLQAAIGMALQAAPREEP